MHTRETPSWFGSLVRSWDRFLFTPEDPTTLGLVRFCAGMLILYSMAAYTRDLEQFCGKHAWVSWETLEDARQNTLVAPPPTKWDNFEPPMPPNDEYEQRMTLEYGINPRQAIDKGFWQWSIFFHVTNSRAMFWIHVFIMACTLCFTLGFATRITSVLTWLGMLSYINRAPNALFGMDTIMIIAITYLMIGPSGAALSLDRWIGLKVASRRRGDPSPTWDQFLHPAPRISANFAIRLLQIHVCFIYGASGISKLQGTGWWQGTAVWGTMANYEFSPMKYQLYMDFLHFLAHNRPLWEITLTALTFGTLIFEVGFPFLVWSSRWRWTMLSAAVGLHLGIAFFMGLVMFSMIMLAVVLSFVPPDLVRDLFVRLTSGKSRSNTAALAA